MAIDRVIREALQDMLSMADEIPLNFSNFLYARGIEPHEFEEYMKSDDASFLDLKIKERYKSLMEQSGYYRKQLGIHQRPYHYKTV